MVKRNHKLVKAQKDYQCVLCKKPIPKGSMYYSKVYVDTEIGWNYHIGDNTACWSTWDAYLKLNFCSYECLKQLYKKKIPKSLIEAIDVVRQEAIKKRGLIKD